MYASYNYYESGYLMGRDPKLSEDDFPFWEKQAERVLNQYTFSRLASNLGLITDEVKDCACELAELLYQADKSTQQAAEQGGVLQSYANPEYKLYPKIRDLALGRKKGDTCKSLMLEVIVEDTTAAKHLAYVQEVLVKPQSYGGGTEGVNFPFNIEEDGARVKGYVTGESVKSGNPVFTAGEIEAA